MTTPPDTAVEITFLSHDNPAYLKAFQAGFDAYHGGHANVTVKPTNITYQALTRSSHRRSQVGQARGGPR
jgi:hypothetical protein